VARRSGRDQLAFTLDAVLVAEAGAADVDAPEADRESVVEVGREVVLQLDAGRERLDALLLNRPVATRVIREVGNPGDLEPHDVRRMMGDALGVGLREAHTHLVGVVEAF
jgi:ABC-type amino acid transport substrate-binding protein